MELRINRVRINRSRPVFFINLAGEEMTFRFKVRILVVALVSWRKNNFDLKFDVSEYRTSNLPAETKRVEGKKFARWW